ncbi:hypothetical protein M758_6G116000 [Ceratodon purpureus]|uniref:Uncharacterized protein n=1 Tax=Ceratodon purpureus TaxID=3225 RepID=A0A8T0HF00_CERPU|nr:hypothetical protein KC19_6G120500 [Ceratodon purpureus]KAG0613612.1 hypothetical protein M758_6G116000 [Ceratodon purpureus]
MSTWLVEDYPGPGEYTPNIDFVKVVFPKYSIPRSTYRYDPDIPAPGPGYYNIPRDIPGPFYTMAAKKHAVIKRQGPRLPPPARGHRNYGPFGWQPRTPESLGQVKKIGQGIITMHYKQKPEE